MLHAFNMADGRCFKIETDDEVAATSPDGVPYFVSNIKKITGADDIEVGIEEITLEPLEDPMMFHLHITEDGMCIKHSATDVRVQARGQYGQTIGPPTGGVIAVSVLASNKDRIIVIGENASLLMTTVKDIRASPRVSGGVRLTNFGEGVRITSASVINDL